MNMICFSHLRWNFVYQRPQHLLGRFAREYRVFYFEEPFFDADRTHLQRTETKEQVTVLVPHIQGRPSEQEVYAIEKQLLDEFLKESSIAPDVLWYYTPMALEFSRHLNAKTVVFDCMDELSAFKFAPPRLIELEKELLQKADVVFTGGHSLYEAKKDLHKNIHPFPSSIDKQHFSQARSIVDDPADQTDIPQPRLGFFGVLDERFDIDLIRDAATARPDWQFVLIGPVVKIDEQTLPRNSNIHYLGSKSYADLPSYLAGWQVALIPFAINESTRFISPTKTPEYLAAGKPVVSTAIRDVVSPYGHEGLVHIINDADEFVRHAEQALNQTEKEAWLQRVDEFLRDNSWDNTQRRMQEIIEAHRETKQFENHTKQPTYV
jgi:glycosyltransferase involved in cell wall biosynthesis